ncbi:MAG: hypothetical protein LBE22_06240 [Azoarcus sp.]|jgi:hypothetical protein|nr:hypothetical protein [Azoarcus sp.]
METRLKNDNKIGTAKLPVPLFRKEKPKERKSKDDSIKLAGFFQFLCVEAHAVPESLPRHNRLPT